VPEGTGAEASGILKAFFKSAAFKELAGAEILAREWPFVVPRGGGAMQGVIDVLYRVRGKLVVADYKTDKLLQPQDYALIRDVYTDAVKRALGEAPRFKLIYLRHGKSVEL
jgi:ATP-dependent exoDNAse (exonuclease V) beta subunit